MRINSNAAMAVQAASGLAVLGLGSALWMGSFGRSRYVPTERGGFPIHSNGPSREAVSPLCCFSFLFRI